MKHGTRKMFNLLVFTVCLITPRVNAAVNECIDTEISHNCGCISEYTGDGITDIDECSYDCIEDGACEDSERSSYSCEAGYTGDGIVCTDINECTSDSHNCSENSACVNTKGSFSCICESGYEGDGFVCEDINECTSDAHNCSETAACVNREGFFTCIYVVNECIDTEISHNCGCISDYIGDGITDIDECSYDCIEDGACEDRERSSYSCEAGYTGDGIVCTDINECTSDSHNCSENSECVNTKGSFSCICESGYEGDGFVCEAAVNECIDTESSYTCGCISEYTGDGITDLDECTSGSYDCTEHRACENPEESVCEAGYTGDGIVCTDINECTSDSHNCSENATCVNSDGSFTCICELGYTGDGFVCEDINECTSDAHNCSENAACVNREGFFTCICESGYSGDGLVCGDINECTSDAHNCSENAACVNREGFFTCICESGYSGDGLVCGDINECTSDAHNCSENAACGNREGFFTCICESGYSGDGLVCGGFTTVCVNPPGGNYNGLEMSFQVPRYMADVDECESNTTICDVTESCTNTIGSFTCIKQTKEPEYDTRPSIIGGIFGAVFICVIIVAVLVVVLRKTKLCSRLKRLTSSDDPYVVLMWNKN